MIDLEKLEDRGAVFALGVDIGLFEAYCECDRTFFIFDVLPETAREYVEDCLKKNERKANITTRGGKLIITVHQK